MAKEFSVWYVRQHETAGPEFRTALGTRTKEGDDLEFKVRESMKINFGYTTFRFRVRGEKYLYNNILKNKESLILKKESFGIPNTQSKQLMSNSNLK